MDISPMFKKDQLTIYYRPVTNLDTFPFTPVVFYNSFIGINAGTYYRIR